MAQRDVTSAAEGRRWAAAGLASCLGGICTFAVSAAVALPADLGKQQVHRVLPPAAGPVVEAGFARAAPAFRLVTAELKHDRVLATVDAAAGTRHRIALSDPEAGCEGTVAGPWCVRFLGDAPSDAAALVAALGAEKGAVWQQVTETVGVPEGWTATGADAVVHDGHVRPAPAPAAPTPEHPAAEQALPPPPPPVTPDPSPASVDRSAVAAGLAALLLLGGLLLLWLRRGRT